MSLDVELEFDNYCKVVRSPKVGRTSHCCASRNEEKIEKGNPTSKGYLIRNVDDDFSEISCSKSRSSSYKNMAYAPSGISNYEAPRRDSMYESLKEVNQMKRMAPPEIRSKIEWSPSSDTSLSFRIYDSSSRPDKASTLLDQNNLSMLSLDADLKQSSVNKTFTDADHIDLTDLSFRFPSTPACVDATNTLSHSCFTIPMDSEDEKQCPVKKLEQGSREQLNFRRDRTTGRPNDGNDIPKMDVFRTLHKSSSEKVGRSYSSYGQESDHSTGNGKTRFSPFRRMFEPIMKSKSLRGLPVSRADVGCGTTTGLQGTKRSKTLRKSLPSDFSNTAPKTELPARSVKKELQGSVVPSSPVHLRGHLTMELKHGVPYFEFSLNDPEYVLSSETWRANNAFNWVYTFHSMNDRRSSNSNGWGMRERRKESSMVGQMQASCFLLSEMRHTGEFDNSMVTEFVLYDIMHARRALANKDSFYESIYSTKPINHTTGENLVAGSAFDTNELSDGLNHNLHTEDASDNDDSDASSQYPWAQVDLHPNLEIAAIAIQVPFEKRESLKEKRGDKLGSNEHLNLFEFSAIDKKSDDGPKTGSCVKVVTPTGTHGLPSKTEDGAPSRLLDRWRSGGRCDCGGWDMACPFMVIDDLGVQDMVDQPFTKNQREIELFFQGTKEKLPALTITFTGEGQYTVDFHARLSKLQAFSICVAMLHGSEASTAIAQEETKQSLPCSSLKMLLDDEVKFLMKAVADKETRKLTQPNLSPIGRS